MAVQRYISTRFWEDKWIRSLNKEDKYLYLYLLTNPLTNIAGVYQITLDRICFDTALKEAEAKGILDGFARAGKAYFYDEEWIILPAWPKHQRVTDRSNLRKGIDEILMALPEEVYRAVIEARHQYQYMDEILEQRPLKTVEDPSRPFEVSKSLRKTSNYSDSDSNSDSDSDKEREGAKSPRAPRKPDLVEGEFDNVRLTTAEREKLVTQYGEDTTKAAIEQLSAWKESSGKRVKNDYAALLKWAINAAIEHHNRAPPQIAPGELPDHLKYLFNEDGEYALG